jgi:hypothetical protein
LVGSPVLGKICNIPVSFNISKAKRALGYVIDPPATTPTFALL